MNSLGLYRLSSLEFLNELLLGLAWVKKPKP